MATILWKLCIWCFVPSFFCVDVVRQSYTKCPGIYHSLPSSQCFMVLLLMDTWGIWTLIPERHLAAVLRRHFFYYSGIHVFWQKKYLISCWKVGRYDSKTQLSAINSSGGKLQISWRPDLRKNRRKKSVKNCDLKALDFPQPVIE